jgi:hypothetical protein
MPEAEGKLQNGGAVGEGKVGWGGGEDIGDVPVSKIAQDGPSIIAAPGFVVNGWTKD